jgi:hypothetical protein
MILCARRASNPFCLVRSLVLYPLSYGRSKEPVYPRERAARYAPVRPRAGAYRLVRVLPRRPRSPLAPRTAPVVPERPGKSDQKQNVRAPSEHHSRPRHTSGQAFRGRLPREHMTRATRAGTRPGSRSLSGASPWPDSQPHRRMGCRAGPARPRVDHRTQRRDRCERLAHSERASWVPRRRRQLTRVGEICYPRRG